MLDGLSPDCTGCKVALAQAYQQGHAVCAGCGIRWGIDKGGEGQADRIEAKLDQVLALLTDEGVEDEEVEQAVEIVTMDGKRHSVSRSPNGTL